MPLHLNINEPFFLVTILTGLIFVLMGLIQLKFPPRKINSLYGYRTSASMKNQERWDFAQRYSAREMMRLGGVLCALSVLGLFGMLNETWGVISGLAALILVVVLLLVRTERAIRERFGVD